MEGGQVAEEEAGEVQRKSGEYIGVSNPVHSPVVKKKSSIDSLIVRRKSSRRGNKTFKQQAYEEDPFWSNEDDSDKVLADTDIKDDVDVKVVVIVEAEAFVEAAVVEDEIVCVENDVDVEGDANVEADIIVEADVIIEADAIVKAVVVEDEIVPLNITDVTIEIEMEEKEAEQEQEEKQNQEHRREIRFLIEHHKIQINQLKEKLVEKDALIEQLDTEINDKTENLTYFLDQNNKLKNIIKQKNEEAQQQQYLQKQHNQQEQQQLKQQQKQQQLQQNQLHQHKTTFTPHQLDQEKNMDTLSQHTPSVKLTTDDYDGESTATSTCGERNVGECSCCTTTVRGLNRLKQYVDNQVDAMRQNMEGIYSHPAENNPSSTENVDPFENSSTPNGNGKNTNTYVLDSDDTSKQHFAWEKSSTGVARKTLEKMGYKGVGGLGKNEDGIEEAITVDNIRPTNTKTLIFSSSITRDINPNGFNKQLKGNRATFHKFNGKRIHHIKKYIPVHLDEEDDVDSVVIIAGGNDIPVSKSNSASVSTIADDIIEAGLLCRNEYGVKHIYIASILPRSSTYYQLRRKDLNNLLKERCGVNGFTFIDNENIILKNHIGHDGVHLNKAGTTLLYRNLHHYLKV